MGYVWRTREGPLSTIGVWCVLSTQGSISSPPALLVPGGKVKMKRLKVTIGNNAPTAAAGGNVFLVRITGGGMGEQVFSIGGTTQPFTTDGANMGADVFQYDVDLDCTPGAAFTIEACAASGTVVGTYELAVACGFP